MANGVSRSCVTLRADGADANKKPQGPKHAHRIPPTETAIAVSFCFVRPTKGMTMANPTVAQTLPVTVAAADASGAAVDLVAFPTALTSPVYTSDNAAAVLTPSGNDVKVAVTV